MDSIDITSAGFSLDNIPDLNEVISNTVSNTVGSDYTMYIYIAAAIILLVVAFLVYKFYINKQKQVSFQDSPDMCYNDTCSR